MSERAKMNRSNFNGVHHSVVDFWRREVGGISSRSFSNRFSASENMVLRLEIYRKLVKHTGCVNTVSFNFEGDILISGSDDRRVILWDWQLGNVKLSFDSGHDDNIFQAKFIPFSNDRIIVTCAADGMVRRASIRESGKVETSILGLHEGEVRKLCIDPGNSHIFYTCGEDGIVQRFDLRTRAPTKLFTSRLEFSHMMYMSPYSLKSIAIDPRNPNLFAAGGMDKYARLYDIRRVKPGYSRAADHFCPPHLLGIQIGIKDLAFSEQSELLVSYHNDFPYLFTLDMGLGTSPIRSSLLSERSDNIQLSVPLAYKGCWSGKGVNFFGPSSEYVVSGTYQICIWRKKDAELIRVVEADRYVKCIEMHPHIPVLASSGIERDIKVLTPTAAEKATLSDDESVSGSLQVHDVDDIDNRLGYFFDEY